MKIDELRGRRTVVYCRVAGDDIRQRTSLELILRHQREYTQRHGLDLINIYVDEGSKTDARDRMLADCRAENIDLVLVKSLDKLDRDLSVVMSIIRQLGELSVGIYFECEDIYTIGEDAILDILTLLAKEESRMKSRTIIYRMADWKADIERRRPRTTVEAIRKRIAAKDAVDAVNEMAQRATRVIKEWSKQYE